MKKTTQERFNNVLSFKNDREKLHFEAEMISLDIMHEVQKLMTKNNLNKTQLAKRLKVSGSYITYLFVGDRLINLKTMAKLQRIFDVEFSIKIKGGKK